jgi:hypothetical protein
LDRVHLPETTSSTILVFLAFSILKNPAEQFKMVFGKKERAIGKKCLITFVSKFCKLKDTTNPAANFKQIF